MVSLLLAIIYLAFIGLGLPDALLGAAWPMAVGELGVPLSYAGIISMIVTAGTIVSSLASDWMTRKLGTGLVTAISIGVTAAAAVGFSISHSFWLLCLFAIPYGLGAGAVDAALNNYVALHYASRHMSWLHCFWGVGAIISPYIMSYALIHSTWMTGYRMVAYLQLIIAGVLLFTLPLWKVNKPLTKNENDSRILGIKGALKIKGVPYLLIGFFSYCAAEATAIYWASSYLEIARGFSKDEAAAFGSLFFIGLTVGRFLAGFVSERLGDNKMIRIGAGIALSGIILIAIPIQAATVMGFVIIGFGCAPIYPCIIHSTPNNFGAENSQGIIGVQMASAYVGSTLMPPLFGLIANHISLSLMPVFLAFFIVLLFFMINKTEKAVS